MVSTFTPNIQLEEPARGDQVGVWDTPVNSNMTLVDLVVGGIATIGLNNSPVVLSAAQFKARMITFNSTLTGSVAITFPTSFTKSYDIQNLCTGSSAFSITLQTTAAGGQVIGCPFGETIECFNDATNIKFKNLGRVGSYWDHGGSSVPAWVSVCSVPPYLNCDGTAFSAVTYPQLAVILGGTTLPNSQGKYRLTLNQSASAPVTSSQGGVAGGTLGAIGGAQTTTLSSQNMPPVPITDLGHVHAAATIIVQAGAGAQVMTGGAATPVNILTALTGITAGSASPTSFTNLPPTYVGGLTLIRAG